MKEVWKPVGGYESIYEISSLGRLRNIKRGNIRATWLNWNGYHLVSLVKHKIALHRIVAVTFHGPPPPKHECAHLDGDKNNNAADNLRWVTRSQNHFHKKSHGTTHSNYPGSSGMNLTTAVKLRKLHLKGISQMQLAKKFDVSAATVWRIVNNKSWVTK